MHIDDVPAIRSVSYMAPPDCDGRRQRAFVLEGVAWTVCEDADTGPPKRGPALVFFAPGIMRRVYAYPADWPTLPDDNSMR